MKKTKVRITWNSIGGELDSVTVMTVLDDEALTSALMEMIRDGIVAPGDSFTVEEVN